MCCCAAAKNGLNTGCVTAATLFADSVAWVHIGTGGTVGPYYVTVLLLKESWHTVSSCCCMYSASLHLEVGRESC